MLAAACLAHDIGNPPFLVMLEDAIKSGSNHQKGSTGLIIVIMDNKKTLKALKVMPKDSEYYQNCETT